METTVRCTAHIERSPHVLVARLRLPRPPDGPPGRSRPRGAAALQPRRGGPGRRHRAGRLRHPELAVVLDRSQAGDRLRARRGGAAAQRDRRADRRPAAGDRRQVRDVQPAHGQRAGAHGERLRRPRRDRSAAQEDRLRDVRPPRLARLGRDGRQVRRARSGRRRLGGDRLHPLRPGDGREAGRLPGHPGLRRRGGRGTGPPGLPADEGVAGPAGIPGGRDDHRRHRGRHQRLQGPPAARLQRRGTGRRRLARPPDGPPPRRARRAPAGAPGLPARPLRPRRRSHALRRGRPAGPPRHRAAGGLRSPAPGRPDGEGGPVRRPDPVHGLPLRHRGGGARPAPPGRAGRGPGTPKGRRPLRRRDSVRQDHHRGRGRP